MTVQEMRKLFFLKKCYARLVKVATRQRICIWRWTMLKSKIYYIANILYGILIFSIGLESKVVIFTSLMSIVIVVFSIIGLIKLKQKE